MIRAESPPLAAPAEQPRAAARSLATWRRFLLPSVVFVVALLVLGFEASVSPFEADEADYVATSRYFGYLFLKHDVARQEWGDNHWTRTQPPLTRYIIGGWLTAYRYDLEKMNQPYVSTASSYEVNRQKGRVPADDVLARARQPMVLLGAGAVVGLVLLGTMLDGNMAGLAGAVLALSSTFLRYTFVHAWAEAPLAFFLVLSALLAAVGVRKVGEGGRWGRWAIALGLALGLASATKLTGLVGIPITVAVAGVLAILAWRRGDSVAARRLLYWSVTAAVLALVVFVVVNPYLWRGPISGVLGMLEERRDEMAFQQDQRPEYAVLTFSERPWLTAVGSTRIGPWADLPTAAVPIGLALAALGIWSAVRHAGAIGPAAVAMLLAWLVGYAAAIVAGLGLSYPRYFLPACLLLLPFIGAGIGAIVSLIRRRASPLSS